MKEIYDNYLTDMDFYNVSNETILKTRKVYRKIFTQLNKENKNFKVMQIIFPNCFAIMHSRSALHF